MAGRTPSLKTPLRIGRKIKMKASTDTLELGDKVIFRCDEYGDGNIVDFDGSVQDINDKGVDVLYLSGYKSRNDFIPFKDVIAKVDLKAPRIKLKSGSFSGHLIEFEQ